MKINLKYLLVFAGFVLLSVTAVKAQTVTGTVYDSDGFPLQDVEVSVKGSTESTVTDAEGNFSLQVPSGKGNIEVFSVSGNESYSYNVADGETFELGEINLAPTLNEVVVVGRGVIDVEEDRKTPVAVSTIFKDEIQEKAQGNVEFPEVLSNTPSVYVSNQSGGFGDSQMFTRGFDQTNTAFLLNGQPINGMEDGKMYWSNWSGMTEIANAVQIQRGLGSSKLAISSVGGTINIITKSTEKKRGGYVSGVVGNDSYFKVGGGYNTGLSAKGWAFSIALSHWQAHRKWATGTGGQGQNYFLSLGKKINDQHSLNFLVTGAPQWHDQNFTKSKEVYEEYGPKYNNNYGFYQDGKYQTQRRNYYHKPVMNLNWDWNINDRMNLSTVAYASFGRGGGTGGYGTGYVNNDDGHLDWTTIETNNETVVAPGAVTGGQTLPDNFTGNNIGYYYWNDLGDANADGNLQRQRRGLILRSSVNNHSWFGGVTNFNMDVNENFSFNVGADVRFYKGDHFRQVVNYLGLDGYYDQQGFAQRGIVTESFDPNPWRALTNFAKEDQRINYDFSEWINYQGMFGQAEYATDKFSVFVQGSFSNQSYQREDRYNFDSAKKGGKIGKGGYNIKGGASYNINASNTLFVNAGHYSRQPFLDNIYSGNFQDATETIQPEIPNQKITGFELGYRFIRNFLTLNVNGYYTTWDNRSESDFGVDNNGTPNNTNDDINLQTQTSGLKQEHKGIEIDYNAKVSSKFNLRGYFSYGSWNRVDGYKVKVFNNDTQVLISETDVVLEKDEKITQAPQFSTGLGVKYKFLNNLSWDADANFYARNYDRNVNDNYTTLTPYAIINTGLTYTPRLGSQKLKFRANVYNLLNSNYYSQADQYGYLPGTGLTYNVGVTANF